MNFLEYSKESICFYNSELPLLLYMALKALKRKRKLAILDLGCGDGALLFSLQERGLLRNTGNVLGVDLSRIRIQRLKRELKWCLGLVADACNTPIKGERFDFVICNQVIEHVSSDKKLLTEIHRLLKRNGKMYLSTVLKKTLAFYIYRNQGSFRLDPTHIREYNSEREVMKLLDEVGFTIESINISPIKFPIIDLLLRLLVKLSIVNPDTLSDVFVRSIIAKKLRKLKIPAIGYYCVEVLARKI